MGEHRRFTPTTDSLRVSDHDRLRHSLYFYSIDGIIAHFHTVVNRFSRNSFRPKILFLRFFDAKISGMDSTVSTIGYFIYILFPFKKKFAKCKGTLTGPAHNPHEDPHFAEKWYRNG